MTMRRVILKIDTPTQWWMWSDNVEEKTITCLPYAHRDWEGEFVFDLMTFPLSDILSIEGYAETIFNP